MIDQTAMLTSLRAQACQCTGLGIAQLRYEDGGEDLKEAETECTVEVPDERRVGAVGAHYELEAAETLPARPLLDEGPLLQTLTNQSIYSRFVSPSLIKTQEIPCVYTKQHMHELHVDLVLRGLSRPNMLPRTAYFFNDYEADDVPGTNLICDQADFALANVAVYNSIQTTIAEKRNKDKSSQRDPKFQLVLLRQVRHKTRETGMLRLQCYSIPSIVGITTTRQATALVFPSIYPCTLITLYPLRASFWWSLGGTINASSLI